MNMKRMKLGSISAAVVAAFAATALPAVAASLPLPVHSEIFGTIVAVQPDHHTVNVKLGNNTEDHVSVLHARVKRFGTRTGFYALHPGERVRIFSKAVNILNRGFNAYEVDIVGSTHHYRKNRRY
ncbi:MAG TPA: hypothetical protein VFJ58_03890 [Armatimonadota bacterium]|nr:hypothetical protein [Armatimonadota bacterium]